MSDKDENENEAKQRETFGQFCDFIGWTPEMMSDMAESLSEMRVPIRPHYRDELLAIAKDLGHEIGVTLDNRYQAGVLLLIFLGLDDDDDDDDEVEPEPEDEGELQPA